MDAYGSGIILFGGFYHNVNNVGPRTDCTGNAQCVW